MLFVSPAHSLERVFHVLADPSVRGLEAGSGGRFGSEVMPDEVGIVAKGGAPPGPLSKKRHKSKPLGGIPLSPYCKRTRLCCLDWLGSERFGPSLLSCDAQESNAMTFDRECDELSMKLHKKNCEA